jgi:FAD/FMN-containing dehydrogenase/ferredoxin
MEQTLPALRPPPTPTRRLRERPAVRIAALAAALRERLGPQASIEEGLFARRLYSRDLAEVPAAVQSLFLQSTPGLVVRPAEVRDIAATLGFASERRVPLTPRGVGSAGLGGAVPVHAGIVLDLSPFSRILAVDPEGLTVTVEPGARPGEVNQRLERHGLELVTSQTSLFSTLGGWICGGGYGLGGFAHGHVSRHVPELDLVTPAGGLQTLRPGMSGFAEVFGSEGQLGILTRLVLRVRRRPEHTAAHLLLFEGPAEAWSFAAALCASGIRPAHLKFLDRGHVAELNRFEAVERGRAGLKILEEKDSLLLHFESRAEESRFQALDLAAHKARAARHHQALWMWNDRYSPLKLKKHGPSLMASEVVLPVSAVPRWIDRVHERSALLGLHAGVEATVNAVEPGTAESGPGGFLVVAMASWTCDRRERLRYLLSMALSTLLTCDAVALGGRSYGLGIWNSPFLPQRFPAEELTRRLEHKRLCDPAGVLNPGKFPALRSRFWGLPGLLMRPKPFALQMRLFERLLPALGWVARRRALRILPSAAKPEPILESMMECSACGACVHVCPAYQVTLDERVTGRAKLQLAGWLAAGLPVRREDAEAAFACLHCGLCEKVCQSQLPLVDRWDRLEALLEQRFGRPSEALAEFARKVDVDRSFVERVPLGLTPKQRSEAQADLFARLHELRR